MKLFGYWRSSASYRVRIALKLKGVEVEHVAVNLKDGAQSQPDYAAINPQMLVPTLQLDDGMLLTQSLAIIEYLEEEFPLPRLLPEETQLRSQVRAMSAGIASDIAPIQNLRVLKYVKNELGQTGDAVAEWARHWIALGLAATEAVAMRFDTQFLVTDSPGMAECCLIPQLYNARRFGVDTDTLPRLVQVEARCMALPAFQAAAPEQQADAPTSV